MLYAALMRLDTAHMMPQVVLAFIITLAQLTLA
jgi:hypothetical protein